MNWLRCFVCGSSNGYRIESDGLHYDCAGAGQPDMASFVGSHANGLRVQALFVEQGFYAFLDWRPREPNWVQLKLGACEKHVRYLSLLADMVGPLDGLIDTAVVTRLKSVISEDERTEVST